MAKATKKKVKRKTQPASRKVKVAEKRRVVRATKLDGVRMHEVRPRVKRSWLARSKDRSRKSYAFAKRTMLVVIVLLMMMVILATLLQVFNTPERTVTGKIQQMAEDYYENYYYDKVVESVDAPVGEVLSKYAEKGLDKMELEQLLLFDGGRYKSAGATLKAYCDEKATYVKIYPEEPYGRKDYRVEANYACNF